jgi:hypothetical protein
MSHQIIHRIYTEDKRRATLVRVIAKEFESFALQSTTGYYRGKPEKSIVLEFAGREGIAGQMAGDAYSSNKSTQASVLVITLHGRSKKITANQL